MMNICFVCLTWCVCLYTVTVDALVPQKALSAIEKSSRNSCNLKNNNNSINTDDVIDRRNALLSSFGYTAAVLFGSSVTMTQPFPASAATAAADDGNSIDELLGRLRGIPTFVIVNQEGVPYMKYNKQERIAIGYAFVSFAGVKTVLGDAQRAAESGGYLDVWQGSTITVIPADVAVRLALKRIERKEQRRGQTLDSIYDVIPGAQNREDALALNKRFSDQGRVPLFYLDGLELAAGTPVYFSTTDLYEEWDRQFPNKSPPQVQALDLVDIFINTARGRTEFLPKKVIFIPSDKDVQMAKELKSKGLPPYKSDQMII